MAAAFIIALIISGIFFFLWQEEHEKLIKAEKQIKDLKRQLKKGQKKPSQSSRSKSGFATIEKTKGAQEYIIKKPQPPVARHLLDQAKLVELQKQTKESQDMLAEIFVQKEESLAVPITTSENGQMLDILMKLLDKDIWTRSEIAEIAGPDVMIGSLLEQINDYSCSKIDDIVVEEDGDKIYVTTEYKTQLT